MRQARGVLVDQDEETLRQWLKLVEQFRMEIGRAIAYVRADPGETGAPEDQSGRDSRWPS